MVYSDVGTNGSEFPTVFNDWGEWGLVYSLYEYGINIMEIFLHLQKKNVLCKNDKEEDWRKCNIFVSFAHFFT